MYSPKVEPKEVFVVQCELQVEEKPRFSSGYLERWSYYLTKKEKMESLHLDMANFEMLIFQPMEAATDEDWVSLERARLKRQMTN